MPLRCDHACCVHTCILLSLQLSGLGDAEKVFVRPGSSSARSTGSVLTQRIVRQAAVALRDLHSMAGSIHLDLKINNLLVSLCCCQCLDP